MLKRIFCSKSTPFFAKITRQTHGTPRILTHKSRTSNCVFAISPTVRSFLSSLSFRSYSSLLSSLCSRLVLLVSTRPCVLQLPRYSRRVSSSFLFFFSLAFPSSSLGILLIMNQSTVSRPTDHIVAMFWIVLATVCRHFNYFNRPVKLIP